MKLSTIDEPKSEVILMAAADGLINVTEATDLMEIVRNSMMNEATALKLFLISRNIKRVRLYGEQTRMGIVFSNVLNDAIQGENGNNIYSQGDIDSFKILFYVEKEDAIIPMYILLPAAVSSMSSLITDNVLRLIETLKKENKELSRDLLLNICTSAVINNVKNKFHAVKDKDSIEIIVKEGK